MVLARRLLIGASGSGSFAVAPAAFQLLNAHSDGWTIADTKFVHYNGRTYFGWVDRADGDVYVAAYTHSTGTVSTPVAMHGSPLNAPADPHDGPSILVRNSDKRIIVAYSAHAGSTCYLRISTNPEDVTAFAAEQNLDASLGGSLYTYMKLAQLTGEASEPIYLLYRDVVGTDGYLAWAKSTDGGATWGAQAHVYIPDSGQRAYTRMGTNGIDRIDILTTTKDPSVASPAALRHLYYQTGAWRASDGTALSLPADKTTTTEVIDASNGSAWSSGLAYDASGKPVSLIMRQHASTMDVRQSRWSGSAWVTTVILDGVDAIDSNAYAPCAMSPDNPDRVWVARKIGAHFEMFRYTSPDQGATWEASQLTFGSTDDNTQPDGVRSADSTLQVIWLKGDGGTAPDYNDGDFAIYGGY